MNRRVYKSIKHAARLAVLGGLVMAWLLFSSVAFAATPTPATPFAPVSVGPKSLAPKNHISSPIPTHIPVPTHIPTNESQAAATSNSLFLTLFVVVTVILFLVALLLLFIWWRTRPQVPQRSVRSETIRRSTGDMQPIVVQQTQMPSGYPQPNQQVLVPTVPRQVTGMLRCPNCGGLVTKEAYFCTNCRLALIPSDSGMHMSVPSVPTKGPMPFPSPLADLPTLLPPSISLEAVENQKTVEIAYDLIPALPPDPEATQPYARNQTMDPHLAFIVGTRSDPGIKRKYKPNEDSLFAARGMIEEAQTAYPYGLFIIADGMGGHANGQDASRLAIQTIVEYILPKLLGRGPLSHEEYAKLLVEGVKNANLAVFQRNMEQGGDMGTTVTGTLVVNNVAYVANVGDSRTYFYRQADGLKKITNDHSVVASLVEAGIIQPDDIYTHPKRSHIYRSLGEKPALEVDSFTVSLQQGDELLVCSDGLWDMVRDPKIEEVMKNAGPHPSVTTEALIQAAFEGGGEDNVSVIVIAVAEATPASSMPRMELLAKPDTVQMPTL